MAFLNQFSTYFTDEQKETEMYKVWSAIGVNMEKALLEEQNALNAEMCDISYFSEDTLRSWLAYFMEKIPYRQSATAEITVAIADGYEGDGRVDIPAYSTLTSDTGKSYLQLEDISLTKGVSKKVKIVQGKRIISTGTYSTIIKMQATNPDLTYLTVELNGNTIPEISYSTSWDNPSYIGSWSPTNIDGKTYGGNPFLTNTEGEKGSFYNVLSDGTAQFEDGGEIIEFKQGDLVIYDGTQWTKINKTNNLNLVTNTRQFGVPRNGYFAYYYNNYLYIKIFSGDEVEDPEGLTYTVTYVNSDGVQGQITESSLTYDGNFTDYPDLTTVQIDVEPVTSTVAINQPSKGKLSLYLKQKIFSSNTISSVPEYTAWFKAQPEVGDCLVMSDWEYYLRNGYQTTTGYIDIYAVDPSGNALTSDVWAELSERIEPVKDVGYLRLMQFERVEHFIDVSFTSSSNDSLFTTYVKEKIQNYYDIDYLLSTKFSIFDSVDISAIYEDILTDDPYEVTGLVIKGMHYYETNMIPESDMTIQAYNSEKDYGGEYLIYDSDLTTLKYTLTEIQIPGNEGSKIYDQYGNEIGTRNGVGISLNTRMLTATEIESTDIIQCYWQMEDEGIISMGADNAMRVLHDVNVSRSSND